MWSGRKWESVSNCEAVIQALINQLLCLTLYNVGEWLKPSPNAREVQVAYFIPAAV